MFIHLHIQSQTLNFLMPSALHHTNHCANFFLILGVTQQNSKQSLQKTVSLQLCILFSFAFSILFRRSLTLCILSWNLGVRFFPKEAENCCLLTHSTHISKVKRHHKLHSYGRIWRGKQLPSCSKM